MERVKEIYKNLKYLGFEVDLNIDTYSDKVLEIFLSQIGIKLKDKLESKLLLEKMKEYGEEYFDIQIQDKSFILNSKSYLIEENFENLIKNVDKILEEENIPYRWLIVSDGKNHSLLYLPLALFFILKENFEGYDYLFNEHFYSMNINKVEGNLDLNFDFNKRLS